MTRSSPLGDFHLTIMEGSHVTLSVTLRKFLASGEAAGQSRLRYLVARHSFRREREGERASGEGTNVCNCCDGRDDRAGHVSRPFHTVVCYCEWRQWDSLTLEEKAVALQTGVHAEGHRLSLLHCHWRKVRRCIWCSRLVFIALC